MRYQADTSARQLELEYPADGTLVFPDPAPAGTTPEETATAAGGATCAICQIRQVMVDSRRPGGTELFHTLCFRCYHDQMQRKRMARQRRAQAVVRGGSMSMSDDLLDTLRPRAARPREPKYRELERRRRQAQMAARREVDGTSTDDFRARRIARAAALAGRAG